MSDHADSLKKLVKGKYAEIVNKSKQNGPSSCCGTSNSCCSDADYTIFSENYNSLEGYNPDADLGLGCGLPTEFARIRPGDTVVDLGSGAGNDCFVARALAGEHGFVIGVDFTQAMIDKARENAEKLGYNNVEFRLGDIENMPVETKTADVIISNCVLNLVPDKVKAFHEIYRVLKTGGHFSVSDVVLQGELPIQLKEAAEMYAGCVSGAVQKEDYMKIIDACRFVNIKVQKEKSIIIPDEVLSKYMTREELSGYKESGTGIYSITVYAEKQWTGCGCC